MPTACAADACIDHRCDWAKNAMLDAEMLLAVAKASVLAGRRDPRQWFLPEEVLGNWAEIAVDRSNNDKSAALPLPPIWILDHKQHHRAIDKLLLLYC